MKHAKVKYVNSRGYESKEYDYQTVIEDLEKDEIVIVEAQNWYSVARFVRYVEVEPKDYELKNIVDRLIIQK